MQKQCAGAGVGLKVTLGVYVGGAEVGRGGGGEVGVRGMGDQGRSTLASRRATEGGPYS